MKRRLFLKHAVTTCGIVVVGIPNLTIAGGEPRPAPTKTGGSFKFKGNPAAGCAVPTYRRDQHDFFPQDIPQLQH